MDNYNTVLNRAALFTDETADYRSPEEPDAGEPVMLRFRTAKDNADRVSYIEENKNIEAEMEKVFSDTLFDYYEYQIIAGDEPVYYYFQVVKQAEVCYYNRLGVTSDIQSCYAFRITPGFHVPEWAKGAVMYQIFVDRFNRGNENNDVMTNEYIYIGVPVYRESVWGKLPGDLDVGRFYGGDLQGVWNKLDYLKYLGVEVIYFNPLFVSPSNHKYDCQDYDHIDPHLTLIQEDGGQLLAPEERSNENATRYQKRSADPDNLAASDRFFEQFLQAVHKRGMRVILDGVFNHCGSFNKWLDRELIYKNQGSYEAGAYLSADSPYRSFFRFNDENAWPHNKSYDGWWGHDTLPKLNYEESPRLYQYIMDIARKWVSAPYHADGWRLDVAADLGRSSAYNHQFWQDFRNQVKNANPEALILAEHYGDPGSWLQGDQWDTVMNYDAFMEPLSWFLTGMEKHSDEYNRHLYGDGAAFFRSMAHHMSRMQIQSVQTAMNQLSNHDHSRFLTRTNQLVGRLQTAGAAMASDGVKVEVFREAVLVQMTWPGAPTLYYGDEAGVCGWTDPDSRRTYPWGREDYELIEFHRYMINFHKRLPALRWGSLKPLKADNHLIAYGRMKGSNRCVIAVNNLPANRPVELPVWELGITDENVMQRVMLTDQDGYNAGVVTFRARAGMLYLEMPPHSGILLTANVER